VQTLRGDRALFGAYLYTACRTNEACTLITTDVMGIKGIRNKILIHSINTKGKQDPREIQIHPKLSGYLEA
jgi:integrase/recombinase XerD